MCVVCDVCVINVSIHASARDATVGAVTVGYGLSVSIHASARDATLLTLVDGIAYRRFNPRIREGCDAQADDRRAVRRAVSIHASARDATLCLRRNRVWSNVSIHASARDATVNVVYEPRTVFVFQSTHPRGMRRLFLSMLNCIRPWLIRIITITLRIPFSSIKRLINESVGPCGLFTIASGFLHKIIGSLKSKERLTPKDSIRFSQLLPN